MAWPVGWPDVIESYQEHARELGYGDNSMLSCQEHEAAHTLVCHLIGLPYSFVMHGVITGQPYVDYAYEEAAVLNLQRFCRLHNISIFDLLDKYQT